jgi:multicomponent Na+:H+ antiporter subunit E
MTRLVRISGNHVRPALTRGAGFLGFWVVLIGTAPADVAAGVVPAALATWASVWLLPPGAWRVRPLALLAFAPRFIWESLVAGGDVARRALDPRLPIRPGFLRYPMRLPRGPARNAFTAISSLLPGTVPAGDDGESVLYHCLDMEQPVMQQLAADEAALAPALDGARRE